MRRSHARRRHSSKPEPMDPIKFNIRPVSRSSNLFSRPPPKSNKSSSSSAFNLSFPITLASSLLLIAFLFFYYLFHGSNYASSSRYSVIIDGGSTGTRLHVFRYEPSRHSFDFELGNMRVNPGLSSFAETTDKAGDSLKKLVDFAKTKVPVEFREKTEIRLMATAGLRLLHSKVQDKILESCRRVLRISGFRFRDEWATVISGSDEGVYAWVVANYALGSLGGDPMQTTGIIELGGASAQVTFVSDESIPSEFSRSIRFGNVTYNLYSHSFLHFGQNVAFESLRKALASGDFASAEFMQNRIHVDPCSPKGYSYELELLKLSPGHLAEHNKHLSTLQARGNFSECRSAALSLLQREKDKCPHKSCYLGSVFMPKLQGKFLATENFFHTSKFFGLHEKAFLSNLILAGEKFCGEDWLELKKQHQSLDDEDLQHYCFSSAYIIALLHDSLGISLDDKRIVFASQVRNIPLDWALGAFILNSSTNSNMMHHHTWIASLIGDDTPTLPSLIVISVLVMILAWFISKCRKPQLKTIYDLEKGRYIISRVNR